MVEVVLNKINQWFHKNDRKSIILLALIVGLIVHFELYSKELLAYDGYWHYGSFLAKGWEISLGRFLIPFSDVLRGSVVVSSLTTLISLIIIGFASIVLNETLNIKKKYIKFLITILLVINPTFSLTLMYPYTANGYAFAMLFAVLSIYFLKKERNTKNILLTILCTISSLGFYQAYLCVITVLLSITYIFKILDDENFCFKTFIKTIFTDIFILSIGIILYYVILNIIIRLLHLSISDYGGGSSILSLETFKNIIPCIKNTYITFFQFYFSNEIIHNTSWFRNILYGFLFLFIIINFIIIIRNKKIYQKPYQFFLFLFILITLPIFACSIELIAQTRSINLLMATSLYFIIILLLKQLEYLNMSKISNIFSASSILMVLFILWTFVLSNNATYVATNLYNKQMFSVGNRIIHRLETTYNISDETPITISGKMNFSLQNPRLLNLTNFDVTDVSIWSWQIFLQDNLGIGRNICDYSDYSKIIESEEYINMPIWPKENSIKMIDDTLVIKVGN